ncbi:nuclear transport factor 2 family protein [Actinoallomurus rhizosphaericola]|uniref:nuclear transport factor 2 family protein n=1 Tax=Actinoallomurus rhizosphaericola TaxID=2952536 RepID=UPI002090DBA7|nr:nuclear transport factor 2 family protein [Actinoallomurus rhizosphaericola]MCO5993118.1 nuclear transport factor 2 family protein [Actinoallomurus rhizosphaericola]
MSAPGDVRTVLDEFFAAEADYISAGGPGVADFGGMAAHLHPDVVMHQAPTLPYGGVWRGHDGMERFMAAMSRVWRSLEFLERRQWTDGDTAIVSNHGRLTARATGRSIETTVLQVFTVRDLLIAEIRPFYWDTAAIGATLRTAVSTGVTA